MEPVPKVDHVTSEADSSADDQPVVDVHPVGVDLLAVDVPILVILGTLNLDRLAVDPSTVVIRIPIIPPSVDEALTDVGKCPQLLSGGKIQKRNKNEQNWKLFQTKTAKIFKKTNVPNPWYFAM